MQVFPQKATGLDIINGTVTGALVSRNGKHYTVEKTFHATLSGEEDLAELLSRLADGCFSSFPFLSNFLIFH